MLYRHILFSALMATATVPYQSTYAAIKSKSVVVKANMSLSDQMIRDAIAFGLPKNFTMSGTLLSPSRKMLMVTGNLNAPSNRQQIYFFKSSDVDGENSKARSVLKEGEGLERPIDHLTGVSPDDQYLRFTYEALKSGETREVVFNVDDARLIKGKSRREVYLTPDSDYSIAVDFLDEKKSVILSSEPLGSKRFKVRDDKATKADVRVKVMRDTVSKDFLHQLTNRKGKQAKSLKFFNVFERSGDDVMVETYAKLKDLKYVSMTDFKSPAPIDKEGMSVIRSIFHPRKASFKVLSPEINNTIETDVVIAQLGDTLEFIDIDRQAPVRTVSLPKLNWEYSDKNGKLPEDHLEKDVGTIKSQHVVDYVLFHPTAKGKEGERTILIATKSQVIVAPFAAGPGRIEYMPKNFGEIASLVVEKKEAQGGEGAFLVFAKSEKGKTHKVATFNMSLMVPDKNTPMHEGSDLESGSFAALPEVSEENVN